MRVWRHSLGRGLPCERRLHELPHERPAAAARGLHWSGLTLMSYEATLWLCYGYCINQEGGSIMAAPPASAREVAQSWPTLCDPMDCSLPGSSVHGLFQARTLEWGAIPFQEGLKVPAVPTAPPIFFQPLSLRLVCPGSADSVNTTALGAGSATQRAQSAGWTATRLPINKYDGRLKLPSFQWLVEQVHIKSGWTQKDSTIPSTSSTWSIFTEHPATAKYTFFSSAHITYTKPRLTQYVLGHKQTSSIEKKPWNYSVRPLTTMESNLKLRIER